MVSEEVICFLPRHFRITGFRAVIPWNRDLFASGHNRTWACTRHHTVKKLTPALAYLQGAPVFTHLSVQPAVHSKRTNKPLLLLPQPSGSLRSAAWWEPGGEASGMCWHCWRHTWGHHTFSCLTHAYLEDWRGGRLLGVGEGCGGPQHLEAFAQYPANLCVGVCAASRWFTAAVTDMSVKYEFEPNSL